MITRTFVTITAVLLGMSFVSVSFAQASPSGAQDEIEVITIIGKRPEATTVLCERDVVMGKDAAVMERNANGRSNDGGSGASEINTTSTRRIAKHCAAQTVHAAEEHI